MTINDLIDFMRREIETEKRDGESYEQREAFQTAIIESLARLRDLED
jgi:hypothetical protein